MLHSFKRSISKHKKEFIDNCEECDDPYEEDSLSHKKETYTPSLFNATNRNLNVSSKLKISPYVSNLKQTQKSNSITKDIVKEDDDTQSEEIKPVPVLLREEKKDQSLIDEEIPTESNPHKNEEKIKDKNEGNPIRQGHRTFSQRIKEVENIISEKKAKYEKQKEEYSIKVKQLLERHNMNPCDG